MLRVIKLSIVMLSVVMLSVFKQSFFKLLIVMLSVVKLSIVMLSVVMLSGIFLVTLRNKIKKKKNGRNSSLLTFGKYIRRCPGANVVKLYVTNFCDKLECSSPTRLFRIVM